jgi:hypothetical protein
MNNLAYNSQKPDVVGPQVEELLRKELGATAPIPYQVEDEGASRTSLGTILKEGVGTLFGREATPLFTLIFNIAQPRAATLRVSLSRQGIGCHAGSLLYSAKLAKPVKGEVSMEQPKTFGASKFTGNPETGGKLNANGELVKRLNKFARTKANVGGLDIEMPRFVRVAPADSGAMLVVNTLPRQTSMGLGAAMDAPEFLAIAGMVESAL